MPAPDPPADPVEFQFLNEIGNIAQLSAARFEARLPDAMSLAQFRVLNHFARLGGERAMHELANAFQITKGAMGTEIAALRAAFPAATFEQTLPVLRDLTRWLDANR